jgi:hypothetical protein
VEVLGTGVPRRVLPHQWLPQKLNRVDAESSLELFHGLSNPEEVARESFPNPPKILCLFSDKVNGLLFHVLLWEPLFVGWMVDQRFSFCAEQCPRLRSTRGIAHCITSIHVRPPLQENLHSSADFIWSVPRWECLLHWDPSLAATLGVAAESGQLHFSFQPSLSQR